MIYNKDDMKSLIINLSRAEDVKTFANGVRNFKGYVEVVLGKFVLDGKSILALYSLNLNNNLMVSVQSSEYNKLYELVTTMNVFVSEI